MEANAGGLAPGVQLKRGRRDYMSRGWCQDHETHRDRWPELVGAHRLWIDGWRACRGPLNVGDSCDLVCLWDPWQWEQTWSLVHELVFWSHSLWWDNLISLDIMREGLGPDSTWYARLSWLPIGGLTRSGQEEREGELWLVYKMNKTLR